MERKLLRTEGRSSNGIPTISCLPLIHGNFRTRSRNFGNGTWMTHLLYGHIDQFLNHLNSLHSSIKFTMEIEENNQIPFLDVLVTRDKDQLRHTVYRKKTHSDRYLNAQSHHHPQQRRTLMKTLFHRAETICDEDSKERELKHIKWALKCNGFSDRDIRFARKVRQHTEQQSYQKFACLPYVQGVTDRIRKMLGKRNIGTRFTTEKKISQIRPTPKDLKGFTK
jgi:hypothetical protein